jgi:hypothetical protein
VRTGPWPGKAGDRHQAAHALRDLVEARPLDVRPVLAEAEMLARMMRGLILLSDS